LASQSGTNFRECIGLWYGNRINTERCQRLETTPATAELLYFDVVREIVIPVLPAVLHNPTVFFATCARLIGPEVKLTIEQSLPGSLSMEDWQVMREVVSCPASALVRQN
jgi:hypothetical protein